MQLTNNNDELKIINNQKNQLTKNKKKTVNNNKLQLRKEDQQIPNNKNQKRMKNIMVKMADNKNKLELSWAKLSPTMSCDSA